MVIVNQLEGATLGKDRGVFIERAIPKSDGFAADFFTEPLEALQAARCHAPDLLISEVSMPLLSGI